MANPSTSFFNTHMNAMSARDMMNGSQLPLPSGMRVEKDQMGYGITLCWDGWYYRVDEGTWQEMHHNRAMYDKVMETMYQGKKKYEQSRMQTACMPQYLVDTMPISVRKKDVPDVSNSVKEEELLLLLTSHK
jgi:hypothetical protein